MPTADLILYNAKLLCPAGSVSSADALAVRDGRIVAVDSSRNLKSLDCAESQDLSGRLLTPGFWDAHIHLYHWCRARKHLNLTGAQDLEEVLQRVARVPADQEWVVGWHLNSSAWVDSTLPNRDELDAVSGGRPVILWLSDLHSAVANTAALQAAELTYPHPVVAGGVVEVDVKGRPTGVLRELAANLVRDQIPEPGGERFGELLREGFRELNSLGITAVSDQRIKDLEDGALVFRALREIEREGDLPLRVCCNMAAHHLEQAARLGVSTGFGSEHLRVGHLKVFSDGTLGSRTARMLAPLTGEEQCGLYLTAPGEMEEVFRRAAELDFSVSVHSIGDESTRVCLDMFSRLKDDGFPTPRVPHRIEHAQIVADTDVSRFSELGLAVSAQPGHALDDRKIADALLGERCRTGYRFGDFQQSGALLAFGSDGPVSAVDPRFGLQAAVHRRQAGDSPWFPEQSLTFAQALRAYTAGAATAAGMDDLVGTLEIGGRADLVAWSAGFDELSDFSQGRAEFTWSGGREVYRAP